METKICKKCGKELPVDKFYKNKSQKDDQVFLTDSKEIIQNMMHGIIYGKWTFVKRGENFGIKLVKVLPKIHKISLDMIAKDIFRSENK